MSGTDRRAFLASLGAFGALTGMAPLGQAAANDRAGVRALIEAYNASGQQLFREFAATAGNVVFSPYSVGAAMAMVLAGARAQTEREMVEVLKHHIGRAEIGDANAEVLAILNGYGKSTEPLRCFRNMRLSGAYCEAAPQANGDCPPPSERSGARCVMPALPPPSANLLVANALMLTRSGALVSDDYATLLQNKYAAEIFRGVDLDKVNDWIKLKTEGKIDKIIDQLDPATAAVVLNAVYFKSAWASVFSKQATRNANFNLAPSLQVQVPTMHRQGAYSVTTQAGYRAIRLPYVIRTIGMVIVLPDAADGVAAVNARLSVRGLPELFAELRTVPPKFVSLALPRFKSAFRVDLVPLLRQAGLRLAFDRREADFSGITGQPVSAGGLVIDQISHQAVIEVREEGTEAAAATAVTLMPTSAPGRPEPFQIDRPFLYYIVDDATGAILFQGRVVDPR